MSLTVEFHFDFASPNAYLSHVVLPAIESRAGVAFSYVPVRLGGVFKDRRGTHGSSPVAAERTGTCAALGAAGGTASVYRDWR